MTANEMREQATDCYRRAERAKLAARLVKEDRREWLLRMSEQWRTLGQQFEAAAPGERWSEQFCSASPVGIR